MTPVLIGAAPVADRLYISAADGGRAVTDAVRETYIISKAARTLANQPIESPKNGARFHFELPGSVQGFTLEESPESDGTAVIENVVGNSVNGTRSLAIRYNQLGGRQNGARGNADLHSARSH